MTLSPSYQKSKVVALKSLVVKQRRNKELSILKVLRHHPNVVDLIYFYFSGQDEDLQLNLFFERVDSVTSSAVIFTSLEHVKLQACFSKPVIATGSRTKRYFFLLFDPFSQVARIQPSVMSQLR